MEVDLQQPAQAKRPLDQATSPASLSKRGCGLGGEAQAAPSAAPAAAATAPAAVTVPAAVTAPAAFANPIG
eukprot:7281576-Prymnesium_polylepis.1